MGALRATPTVFTSEGEVRQAYRAHRYLEDLSDAALQLAEQDAFRNFLTVNEAGKTAPLPIDHPRHWYWRVRLLHLLEECAVRFGPYPAGFGDRFKLNLKLPRADSLRVQSAAAAFDRRGLIDGEYLIKYGKRNHLVNMLNRGEIRLSPASEYASGKHNDAISDTELQFTYRLYNPSAALLAQHGALPNFEPPSFVHRGTALLERALADDYYLFCLSATYDPRLFDDFDADSCLVIRSPLEFRRRLLDGVASLLRARGWAFGPVTYVDPFSRPDPTVALPFCKHHRYSYQDEVRGAWLLPTELTAALEPIFVELGTLRDIAVLVTPQ